MHPSVDYQQRPWTRPYGNCTYRKYPNAYDFSRKYLNAYDFSRKYLNAYDFSRKYLNAYDFSRKYPNAYDFSRKYPKPLRRRIGESSRSFRNVPSFTESLSMSARAG
ncbi:uncharacterized [Tachysurus ichikawai]